MKLPAGFYIVTELQDVKYGNATERGIHANNRYLDMAARQSYHKDSSGKLTLSWRFIIWKQRKTKRHWEKN